jgi:uncharacterized protein
VISQFARTAIWNDDTGRARATWRVLVPVTAVMLIGAIVDVPVWEDLLPLPVAALVVIGVTAALALVIVQSSGRLLDAGRSVVDYGFTVDRAWLRDVMAGFGIGLAGVSIPFLVGLAVGWFEVAAVFDPGDLAVGTGIAVIVIATLCTGIWEELLARGVVLTNAAEGLQTWLSPRYAVVGGVTISALLFGVAHAGQPENPLFLLTWVLAGVVLGVLYVLSGDLALVIGVHWSFNVAYQAVFIRTDVNPEEFSAIARIDLATQSPLFEFGGVVEVAAWFSVLVLGVLWLSYSRDASSIRLSRLGVKAEP